MFLSHRSLILHYVYPAVADDTNPLYTYASCKANWWFFICKLYASSTSVYNISVGNIYLSVSTKFWGSTDCGVFLWQFMDVQHSKLQYVLGLLLRLGRVDTQVIQSGWTYIKMCYYLLSCLFNFLLYLGSYLLLVKNHFLWWTTSFDFFHSSSGPCPKWWWSVVLITLTAGDQNIGSLPFRTWTWRWLKKVETSSPSLNLVFNQ